jgi:TPR repeat protein
MKIHFALGCRLAGIVLASLFLAVPGPGSTAWADMAVGTEAFAVKDYKRAYREFESAWKAGDPRAAYNLGMMHGGGYGVANSNMEAAKWYRLAADQGVNEAMDILGSWYLRGVGVRKDPHMALAFFMRAATAGFAPSRYHLGLMYFADIGPLKKDLAKAIELFSSAANADHAPAQFALGELLNGYEGIQPDRIVAWQWLALAVDGGERQARRALQKLTSELSVTDLAAARTGYEQIKAARSARPTTKQDKVAE